MPSTFVVEEARTSINIAKALGSRFIFVSMNSQMSNEFVPVMQSDSWKKKRSGSVGVWCEMVVARDKSNENSLF